MTLNGFGVVNTSRPSGVSRRRQLVRNSLGFSRCSMSSPATVVANFSPSGGIAWAFMEATSYPASAIELMCSWLMSAPIPSGPRLPEGHEPPRKLLFGTGETFLQQPRRTRGPRTIRNTVCNRSFSVTTENPYSKRTRLSPFAISTLTYLKILCRTEQHFDLGMSTEPDIF
jgi:hypothetical protein